MTLSIWCLLTTACFAQVPDLMNYQAVARNNAGVALANQTIRVRLSILKNAVMQYSETRQVTTNALGLFNVQIGSAGALSTTGSFSGINWQNNAAPGYVLKVELDINNSNVFADMGSQSLVTVPYSFAAKKADEATEPVNINGIPVDRGVVPNTGERLVFDGAKWTSVKRDTVYMIAAQISNIPVTPGVPWVFAGTTSTITVTGNEIISANFTGSFGHSGASNISVACAVCYSDINATVLTSFHPTNFTDAAVLAGGPKSLLSATGAIKLPAGTYKIGMCVKNRSIATILNVNDNMNGTIEIRY